MNTRVQLPTPIRGVGDDSQNLPTMEVLDISSIDAVISTKY